MDIQVHSIHFDADVKLVDFAKKRMEKLNQFQENITNSEIFLRLENDKEHVNKVAEIKLNVPGKELFAKRQCKTFEEAIDQSVEALRRQIRKHKGKTTEV